MVELKRDFIINDIVITNFINLSEDKKEMVRNWRNSENIRKWLFTNHIISEKEHLNFIKSLKHNNQNYYWLVKNKKEEYLGVISLNRINFKNKTAYLGMYVNPEMIGTRYGRILINSIRTLAFDVAKLHTLKLEVLRNNERAINFYKKFDFKEEGILKEVINRNEQWIDVVIMGIINNGE